MHLMLEEDFCVVFLRVFSNFPERSENAQTACPGPLCTKSNNEPKHLNQYRIRGSYWNHWPLQVSVFPRKSRNFKLQTLLSLTS